MNIYDYIATKIKQYSGDVATIYDYNDTVVIDWQNYKLQIGEEGSRYIVIYDDEYGYETEIVVSKRNMKKFIDDLLDSIYPPRMM